MIKRKNRRGDTLIEVMLAVGIFSMVAVAVVAVMSGGTSSAQTALETTLAREEIDTQAEALRFIQRAYLTDKKVGAASAYSNLWTEITGKALSPSNIDTEIEKVAEFHPNSCQELYGDEGEVNNHNAFVINTKNLASYGIKAQNDALTNAWQGTAEIGDVIVSNETGNKPLQQAATYPHLIYIDQENDQALNAQTSDMQGAAHQDTVVPLYRAEGIYVIAVKDPSSTAIVGEASGLNGTLSAYYDFYIRTCWYGTGDQSPSTISTVIRLYNPDVTRGD